VLHQKIFTVSELNTYVKRMVEEDRRLNNLWIKGEISNYKAHSSGHAYFVLKDAGSCVRCVMFRSRVQKLAFNPENGMNVILRGYVSVFERDGIYQIYGEEMQPDGVGALQIAFEQLKAKLEKEGIFDSARKKALPLLPRKIGVVTSLTGAVWHDVQKVVFSRFPNMQLVLAPAAVQGDRAPEEIARAIKCLNTIDGIDLIIVGRGGGSLEELWAFNTETVARAVYSSRIPVISAVGHQTDFTICDFAADRRAATPSAAAEMAVPVKVELEKTIGILRKQMRKNVRTYLAVARQQVAHLKENTVFRYPDRLLREKVQSLDIMKQSMEKSTKNTMIELGNSVRILTGKMDMLSPLTTLSRGYAVCRNRGKILKSPDDVKLGEKVEVLLFQGTLCCTVTEKMKGDLFDCGRKDKF